MKKMKTQKELSAFMTYALSEEESGLIKGGQGSSMVEENAVSFIVEEDADGI